MRPFVAGVTSTLGCAEVETVTGIKFKSLDAGAIAGGAVHLALGRERLVASAQYELGLTQIESSKDLKNRALSFLLGVELPIR